MIYKQTDIIRYKIGLYYSPFRRNEQNGFFTVDNVDPNNLWLANSKFYQPIETVVADTSGIQSHDNKMADMPDQHKPGDKSEDESNATLVNEQNGVLENIVEQYSQGMD